MTPGTLTGSHSAFVTFSAMPEDAKLFLLLYRSSTYFFRFLVTSV